MAHVVILGAGVGGMSMAYDMREQARAQDKITVVSNHPYFQFTPSNPWAAVNWRTRDDTTVDVGPLLERKGIDFIAVGCRRVHPERNALELEDGHEIAYDFLIVATNPKLAFVEVEGLGPNGHTDSVCHVNHAVHAGKVWKGFIMDTDLRRRRIRSKVPMTFVTAEPYIGHLGLGGVGDSKGLLESAMRHRHVKWICNAKVTRVEEGKMHVAEHNEDGQVKKEHVLPFKYSMMLPAFKGIDAVFGVEGLANPRGFILIDEYQRNPRYRNIYAVGVCVAIPPVETTPVPTGAPKTGYMIETRCGRLRTTSARCWTATSRIRRRPGTPSAWPTSAIPARPSSPCRRSRRATSTGSRKASGCIWPRSRSRSTSCASRKKGQPSRCTRNTSWAYLASRS